MAEDRSDFIRVKTDTLLPEDDTFAKQDPFNKTWDELKTLNGLDANFKRRTSRVTKTDASPSYIDNAKAVNTGLDGAKSKEINPGLIYRNGYGLFDVITPPWNLYELASYYDTLQEPYKTWLTDHSAIPTKDLRANAQKARKAKA